MENLLGLVLFIVFIVATLVGKMQKKKGEQEESPPPSDGPPELEDLPEALRRMLMGGGPPVRKATPAPQPAPPDVQPVAQPVARPVAERVKPVIVHAPPPKTTSPRSCRRPRSGTRSRSAI